MRTIDPEQLPLYGDGSLFELLGSVTDPRKKRGIRHPLLSVLAVALCATLVGMRSLAAIAQWAGEQSRDVLERLGCRRNIPPSEPTLRRVLKRVGAEPFDRLAGEWAQRVKAQQQLASRARTASPPDPASETASSVISSTSGPGPKSHGSGAERPDEMTVVLPLIGQRIALDGKTLRGSADGDGKRVHLVSAVAHDDGAVLAQYRVPDKTNEIKSVEPVLAMLNIGGAMITGDAMFTQKDIARHVVEDKKGDFLFAVKDNQPTLRADIDDLHMEASPPAHSTIDKGHGRIEVRRVWVSSELAGFVEFPHVQQVVRVERTCSNLDGSESETHARIFATSASPERASPSQLLADVRGHWTIENKLHYVRDWTFDEDRSQVRKGSTGHLMASLRNLTITASRLAGASNIASALRTVASNTSKLLRMLGLRL